MTTITQNDVDTAKQKLREAAEAVISAIGQRLDYLAGRWEDEREFEDWKDYQAELKKLIEPFPYFTFARTTKRPFALIATFDWFGKNREMSFYVNSKMFGWKVLP